MLGLENHIRRAIEAAGGKWFGIQAPLDITADPFEVQFFHPYTKALLKVPLLLAQLLSVDGAEMEKYIQTEAERLILGRKHE